MAKKKKRTQLSSEGKTELAKAIAEKSQTFAKTYANVEIRLSRVFRWISGWVDKLLFNQKHGKIVALMVAVLFYFGMSSDNSGLFENMKSAETLGEYKVSAVVSNQAYEVTGLDEMVKVRIIGDISDIKSVKQQKNFRVVANLTDLTEGTHEVKYTTEGAPSRVEVVLEPSNGIVTIKKKSIRSFTLGYDFVNRSNMDSIYDLGEPELEQGEVHVRASAETLDSIAYVKALIDVKKNYTSDFTTEATIAAYDDKGNKMDVDIIPDKVEMINNKKSPIQDDYIEKYLTEKVCSEDKESEYSYQVEKVQPVDMFPWSAHAETVVLLSRKDVYERIKFDVNVEDLQGRASSTATYSEIKAYILEKYGLKVSSLYIAQIKDKCGFEKRDNYNIGEGKSKELICPPDKEQAIMDAFSHFGMLRD